MSVDPTIASIIGAAITVGTVLFRTGQLSAAIGHLTLSVEELKKHRDSTDDKIADLDRRVATLEGRAQRKTPP